MLVRYPTCAGSPRGRTPPYALPQAEAAGTKPFATFEEFYPHYLGEHSDGVCRLLHVIGTCLVTAIAATYPTVLPALVAAALMGMGVFPATRHMENGAVEGVAVLATLIAVARTFGTRARVLLGLAIAGYGFAWVGHFVFEGNRPATFIYPTYSLMGDFRMTWDVLTGAIPLGL